MDLVYLLHQPDILKTVCSNLDAEEIIAVRNVLATFYKDPDFVLNCALPIPDISKRITFLQPVDNLTIRAYHTLQKQWFAPYNALTVSREPDVFFKILDAYQNPPYETWFRNKSATGDWSIVKEFLKRGFDVNHDFIKFNNTPLSLAVDYGHLQLVIELLARGANINWKDRRGGTVLFSAILHNHTEVAKELINQGIDLNVVNDQGMTALRLASITGNYKIAQLIGEKL